MSRSRVCAFVDSVSRLLWWLFASSAGARTRARVLAAIHLEPQNAKQLARELQLDYKTIRHHLGVLSENHVIESSGPNYGRVYSVAHHIEERWPEFERIAARHRK